MDSRWEMIDFAHAVQYNTIQYNAMQCNAIQCNITKLYTETQYNTIQHNTIYYNTLHCTAIHYNTIQIQHNTTEYNVPKHCPRSMCIIRVLIDFCLIIHDHFASTRVIIEINQDCSGAIDATVINMGIWITSVSEYLGPPLLICINFILSMDKQLLSL